MLYLLAAALISGSVVHAARLPQVPPTDVVRKIYTFTDDAYPENIAVRANGDILINSLTHGRLYSLDPSARNPTASVIAQFKPDVANGLLGISEYAPDKFAVNGARVDLANAGAEGVGVWSVDLNGHGKGRPTIVEPRKIADLPDSGVANGLTTLGGGVLLAADSALGVIWSINTRTGVVRNVANDTALKASEPTGLPFGVNGVHASRDGSHLYFSNTNTRRVSKVRVHRDGSFVGNVTTVAELPAAQLGPDDFIMGRDGSLWVTGVPNFVTRFLPNGTVTVLDGFNNTVGPAPNGASNPTAVAFGRGSAEQEKLLYVTTSWGVVYAIDTSRV